MQPYIKKRVGIFLLAGLCLPALGACGASESLEGLRQKRAVLRAYDGAPPVIPHEVTTTLYQRCLYCHKNGKIIAGQIAPATPHPEMKNCLQCHVRQQTEDLFVQNNFEPFRITQRIPGKNPAGPPRIAHRLQMRENCEACHLGDTATEALKPKHGPRENCTQCHVHVEAAESDFR